MLWNSFYPGDLMESTPPPPVTTRRDEILIFICMYALENNGVTPSQREIADSFGLHPKTIQTHLQKLIDEGRIDLVGRTPQTRIRVLRSTWEQPDDISL